jgi:hypothetical protein
MPQSARRPPAAWAPAAVHVTSAGAAPEAATDHWQQQQEQQWDDEQDQQYVEQQAEVHSRPQQQPRQQQQQKTVHSKPLGVKERLSLRRAQALQQQQQDKENAPSAAAAAGTARGKAAAAAAAAAMLPVSDHPLASAVMNSTHLLERKMQVGLDAYSSNPLPFDSEAGSTTN